MQQNLSYLNQRQDVLSQNVANANVPGYEAKDLKPLSFQSYMTGTGHQSEVKVQTTNANHISGTNHAGNYPMVRQDRKAGEVTPTGNNVVIEDEVLKMSKNSLEYQQTTNLYRKMIEMLKTAIGN